MVLSFLLVLIAASEALAAPTLSSNSMSTSATTPVIVSSREMSECTDIARFRTTTNIVLSCLTTILACTWVALHLNVPKKSHNTWKNCMRRFGWMVLALIAPEVITGIAVKERLAAKDYMEYWNANFMPLCSPDMVAIPGKSTEQYAHELEDKKFTSRWTLTHGFLVGMGGIRLHDGKSNAEKFRPNPEYLNDPRMRPIIQQIGLISKNDIEDKSKGDWMTKLFVVLQTTWFIFQCFARWAAHLPVTELEVVTLAYAVQNVFIYTLWWRKPQNLSVPFRLYLEEETTSEKLEVSGTKEGTPELQRSPSMNAVNNDWVEPQYTKIRGFMHEKFSGDGYWFFLLIAGTIFGGLHLIPLWLSVFPSLTEQRMWRVSAFYVTVAPMGLPLASMAALLFFSCVLWCCCCGDKDGSEVLTAVFIACAILAYAVARVILLVLPFTTLRALPKEAFRSVEWTRFIPHF